MNQLSSQMASAICKGFIFHDTKDYGLAIHSFSFVYKNLFRIEKLKADKMAKHFVTALKLHDSVEDHFKGSQKYFFQHKIWKKVYNELESFCTIINLNKNYADQYTKFLRYHSAFKKNFEIPLLRAEEEIILFVTKSPELAKIAAPLYLSGINSHDLHTKWTWSLNKKLMKIFYEIILMGD